MIEIHGTDELVRRLLGLGVVPDAKRAAAVSLAPGSRFLADLGGAERGEE